ncbi:hydroxyethylthiazole kinase [Halobacillus salinus]|uniref:hydroxyethylthiazole kinase n=1 Tax=Halobacillus salinus TaxID=192814 RepID=UPI0009A8C58E|nr:hydroxyethylthiazole kinase [Halobacillus salinus]
MNEGILHKVREMNPLVHNMTNQVVMNFSANGLLALGASPIMANAKEDAAEVARQSDGLLLNIGTVGEEQLDAMILAGKAANEQEIPVVMDPVGVAATSYRTKLFESLLSEVQPTVIKGNAGELAHLIGRKLETKGVDFVGETDPTEVAEEVARICGTSVLCTGKKDIVTDGNRTLKNETGTALLTQITGAGCLLGSVVTAYLSVGEDVLESAHAAAAYYGKKAEIAASRTDVRGPGTFLSHFIDQLAGEDMG